MDYPEIDQLVKIRKEYCVKVESVTEPAIGSFAMANFWIGDKSWIIYVDNEYGYFDTNNQPLCIYLVLSALAEYKVCEDYLVWCKENELEAPDTRWLNYYKSLGQVYNEVELILGVIDPFITHFDYELRSGAFSELLKYNAT